MGRMILQSQLVYQILSENVILAVRADLIDSDHSFSSLAENSNNKKHGPIINKHAKEMQQFNNMYIKKNLDRNEEKESDNLLKVATDQLSQLAAQDIEAPIEKPIIDIKESDENPVIDMNEMDDASEKVAEEIKPVAEESPMTEDKAIPEKKQPGQKIVTNIKQVKPLVTIEQKKEVVISATKKILNEEGTDLSVQKIKKSLKTESKALKINLSKEDIDQLTASITTHLKDSMDETKTLINQVAHQLKEKYTEDSKKYTEKLRIAEKGFKRLKKASSIICEMKLKGMEQYECLKEIFQQLKIELFTLIDDDHIYFAKIKEFEDDYMKNELDIKIRQKIDSFEPLDKKEIDAAIKRMKNRYRQKIKSYKDLLKKQVKIKREAKKQLLKIKLNIVRLKEIRGIRDKFSSMEKAIKMNAIEKKNVMKDSIQKQIQILDKHIKTIDETGDKKMKLLDAIDNNQMGMINRQYEHLTSGHEKNFREFKDMEKTVKLDKKNVDQAISELSGYMKDGALGEGRGELDR